MQASLEPKPEEKERDVPARAATAETGATSGVPLFLSGGGQSRSVGVTQTGNQGRPLDEPTRRYFERRFGRDFSDVRVHTGPQAAEKARAVGAVAFTVGSNIAFDEGQYDPAGERGRNLLAHELAHVVQQSGGAGVTRAAPADHKSAEAQADRAAIHAIEHGYAGALTPVAPRLQRQPAPSRATIEDSRLEIGTIFRGAPLGIGINLDDEMRPYFDGDPTLKDSLATYLDGVFNPPGGPVPETARFLSGARVEGLIEKDLPTWIFGGSMPNLVGLLQARADELRKQQVRAKLEERLGVNPGTVDWAAQIPQLRSEFTDFVDLSTVGGAAMYDRAEMFLNILENEIAGAAPVVGGVVPPALADTVFEYAVNEVKYDNNVRLLFAEKFLEVNLDATARLQFVPEGFDLARFAPKGADIAEGRRNDLIDQFIEFQAEQLTTKFLLDEWVTTGADPQVMLANLDVDQEKDKIFDFLADEFMKQAKADPQMASAIRETASDKARFDLLTTIVLVGRNNETFNQGLPALLDKDENDLDDQQRAIVHDPDTYYQTSLNLAEATRTILNDVSAGANVAQSTIQHASEIAGRAEIPRSFGMIATLLAMGMAISELKKAVTEQSVAARKRIADRLKISWKDIAEVINNRGKEADKFIDETFKPLLKKIAKERIQKNYDELKKWQDNFFPETSKVIDRYRLAASILDEVADKLDSGEEKSATLNGESVEKKDVPKIRVASAYMNAKADKLGTAWGKFEKWQELKKAVDAFADVMAGIDSEKYKPNHFGPSVFEEARRQLGIGEFEFGTTVGDVVLRRKSVRDNPFEAWAVERWTYFELVYEQQDQLTTFAIIGVLAIATFLLPGISAAFLAALDVGAGVAGAVEAGVAVAATGADVGFNLREGWKGVKSAQAMLDLARVDTDLSIQGVTVEQAEEALHDAWVGMVITAVLGGLALGIAGAGLFKAVRSMRFPHLAKLAESDPGLAAKLLKTCGDSKLANTLLGHFAGDGLKLAEALELSKDAKSLIAIIGQVKDADLARRLLKFAGGEEQLAPLLTRFKNYRKLQDLLVSARAEELVTLFDLTKSESSVGKLVNAMTPARAQELLESGLTADQSVALHQLGPGVERGYLRMMKVGDADARQGVIQLLRMGEKGYDAKVIENALQKSTEYLAAGKEAGQANVVQRFAKVAEAEDELDKAREELQAAKKLAKEAKEAEEAKAAKQPAEHATPHAEDAAKKAHDPNEEAIKQKQKRVDAAAKKLTSAREGAPTGLGRTADLSGEEFAVDERLQQKLYEEAKAVQARQQKIADDIVARLNLKDADAKSMLKREDPKEFIAGVKEKVGRKGYKKLNQMDDMVRGRINCDTPEQVKQVIAELRSDPSYKTLSEPQVRSGVKEGYPRTHVIMKDPETGITHEWQVGTKATTRAFEGGEGIPEIEIPKGLELKKGMKPNIHDIEYDIFKSMEDSKDVADQQLAKDLGIPEFRRKVAELAAETGQKGNLTPNLDIRITELHTEASKILKELVDRKGPAYVQHFFH